MTPIATNSTHPRRDTSEPLRLAGTDLRALAAGVPVAFGDRGVTVVAGRLELLHGRLLHDVAEIERRQPRAYLLDPPTGRRDAVLVGLGLELDRHLASVTCELECRLVRDRRVHLGELALRAHHDHAGLPTVKHLLPIPPLKSQADPFGHPEHHEWEHDHPYPDEPGDPVHRYLEDHGEEVVTAGDPEQDVEGDERDAYPGAYGLVARPVQDVVLAPVTGDPLLDEGVEEQPAEDERGHDCRRYEHVPARSEERR